jgi:hypothetical protein
VKKPRMMPRPKRRPRLPPVVRLPLLDLTGDPPRAPAPPSTRAADAMSPQARRLRLELLNRQEDRPSYHCPQCSGGAFAESLSHPGMCVRCARAAAGVAA